MKNEKLKMKNGNVKFKKEFNNFSFY